MTKPNWSKIREEWETSNITFKDLAEKHNVKIGTLKSRRSREKWYRGKDATFKKDATLKSKKDATSQKQPRYKPGSRKGAGNPSPEKKFSERNSAARKHGFFSRYIPEATLELMGTLDKDNPADILWDQIQLQYAAIIRAQKIMFVESKEEMIKELKKLKEFDSDTSSSREVEYEFQFAWDRQATFMNAQSRAIAELRASIKQFNELAFENDERLLKLQQIQSNITKTEKETAFIEERTKLIKGTKKDTSILEALIDVVSEDE